LGGRESNSIAEEAISGAKEVKEELNYKYNIDINYQTVYNNTERVAEKLFGKWSDSFD
jgi:hypothetical protein